MDFNDIAVAGGRATGSEVVELVSEFNAASRLITTHVYVYACKHKQRLDSFISCSPDLFVRMKNGFVPEQCGVNSRNFINIETTTAVNQPRCRVLKFGCVNARSVRNKNVAVTDIFADHCLDVLALTETWHERSSDVCLSSVVPPGSSMVE